MANRVDQAVDIFHLREMAKKRLPRPIFDNLDHGSEDDVAFNHNRAVADRIKMVHRVLRPVADRDPSVTLFGKKHDLPIVIGPTGITSWADYRGEVSLAKAAAKANIPFTLTSTTMTPMEKVRELGGGTQWYQAIIWRDTEATLRGIMRAKEAGFEALILTVDSLVPYNRPYDQRHRLTFPPQIKPRNLLEALKHPRWTFGTPVRYLLTDGQLEGMPNLALPTDRPRGDRSFFRKNDALTWDFVSRLRELWPRTLIVKGILHPDDAVEAANRGADGIVVSNHGGATNDTSPSPLEMLPGISAALDGRSTVLVDSGFRRGSDVLKALALGADAVLTGRATLFGLAAGGEAGAHKAVSILGNEITRMMGVLGLSELSEIGRDHLMLPGDLAHLARHAAPWKGPDMELASSDFAPATVE